MGGRTAQLSAAAALSPRWGGQAGRLEVFYATWSDPATGLGGWVHHELVAPLVGPAYVHGWAALFPPDAAPAWERFGPLPAPVGPGSWPSTGQAVLVPPAIHGTAGRLAWDLSWGPGDGPLFTFPSWAWQRETLPAAQIVPVPSAAFSGSVTLGGTVLPLSSEARGGVAHIYGQGNARRWGWLHAELGGGDVLEVVSAVSKRTGLSRLSPLAFVQLRTAGRDWPRHPLAAAPLMHTDLGLPHWSVRGTVGRWRLRVEVEVAPERSVAVPYTDPDGETALCTNSERADAIVVLEHRHRRWETAARWELSGTAHAEVGLRPSS